MKTSSNAILGALLALSAGVAAAAVSPVQPEPAAVTPAPDSAGTAVSLPGGVPAGWKLVWSDEFSRDGLPDPAKWAYDTGRNREGWHNDELQYYSHARLENSRVAGGKLYITARKERLTGEADYGGQAYTSARLITLGKYEFTYGFVEVRAKLPCGLGTWPAIWSLGTTGGWPENGEIDIMEHVGRNVGDVFGSIHTGAYNWPKGTQKTAHTSVPDACDRFHTYQLTWDADQMLIGVDNRNHFHFKNPKDGDPAKWPFDRPQYLILNLAIGGFLGGPVDDKIFPVSMEVDYVRIYKP